MRNLQFVVLIFLIIKWSLSADETLLVEPKIPKLSENINHRDMGTYDHNKQQNDESIYENTCPKLMNCTIEQTYMQRIVTSILRQMRLLEEYKKKSTTLRPGESLTIDLRAEISYNNLKFLKEIHQKPEKSKLTTIEMKMIDEIIENLFTDVELSPNLTIFWKCLYTLKDVGLILSALFLSLKFWIGTLTLVILSFIIYEIMKRMQRTNRQSIDFIFYMFLLIFLLSCIWMYYDKYEEAKSSKLAKIIQNPIRPQDCDYHELSMFEAIWFNTRTVLKRFYLFKEKDQCIQYYIDMQVDPFLIVNPIDAISATAAHFIFGPAGYIGEKIGTFVSELVEPFPILFQPILIIIIFIFSLSSLILLLRFRIKIQFFGINFEVDPHSQRQLQEISQPMESLIESNGQRQINTSEDSNKSNAQSQIDTSLKESNDQRNKENCDSERSNEDASLSSGKNEE